MDKQKPTLAIYGIQDVDDSDWPMVAHDHSIALYHQGSLIEFLQLERLTRKKRDHTLHKQLYALLKKRKYLDQDVDLVFVDNVLGRAFISNEGNIRFEAPLNEHLQSGLEKGFCYWLSGQRPAYALNHELSHVFSSLPFVGRFHENSLLIHFDGGASQSNFSAWSWRDGKAHLIESHWDLKYLTDLFNANALSFAMLGVKRHDQNSLPGKLMGFAQFGHYSAEIEHWLIENDYFKNDWRSRARFFDSAFQTFGYQKKHLDCKDSFVQAVAATFQEIFSRECVKKITQLQDQVRADHLYYAGGCALSIVTNAKLVAEKLFKSIFVPPCADDSGLALGAGAYLEYLKHGALKLHGPYLNNWQIQDYQVVYCDQDIQAVADCLMQRKVVGICNGYGEVGPRALGNRSITALADSVELAKRVSQIHKGREWYRPIAPIMLKEHFQTYVGKETPDAMSQYMLMEYQVLAPHQAEIQGAIHVNGSARIQVLEDRSQNPFFYDLLTYMGQSYGVKALINTSFNSQGEPIVHTTQDAMKSAVKMKLDAVVLNGRLKLL